MLDKRASWYFKGALAALALYLTVPEASRIASGFPQTARPARGLVFYIPGYRGNGNYAGSANDAGKLGFAACQASVPQDGTPSEFAARALAEFDDCRRRYLATPRARVLVICESLGCHSAAYLAAERADAIGMVAFFGPAIYPDGTGKVSAELENPERLARLIAWRRTPITCGGAERNETTELLCAYRKAGGKALVLRGERDEHIPPQAAEDYAAAMGGDVETVPNAGHNAARNPEVVRRIWRWADASGLSMP